MQVGSTQVLMPKFAAMEVPKLIKQHHVTAMIAVPAMIADLVHQVKLATSYNQAWENFNLVEVSSHLIDCVQS